MAATNPYVNKVQYGNTVVLDLTDTTAVASDVAQGKYFYVASGEKVVGTSTAVQLAILVTVDTGSTVTATRNGVTYNGVEDQQNPGNFSIAVPAYGTYTVTATLNSRTATAAVIVAEESVELEYPLPDTFTRLQYIQSSGTQYIDTEIIAESTTGAQGKFAFTSLTPPDGASQTVIGSWSSMPFSLMGVYQNQWFTQMGNETSQGIFEGGTADTNDHEFTSNLNGNQKFTIDGTEYGPWTYVGPHQNDSLWLFARNYHSGTFNSQALVKIYYMDIYAGNTLVGRFYPAKRNSDDAIGMYDTVTDAFFENAGTGTFIAGPVIN